MVQRRVVDPTGFDPGWYGLRLTVTGNPRPALRVEVAGLRQLLLRQDGRPILLARVEGGWQNMIFHRVAGYRSALPPITAREARRAGGSHERGWSARWMGRFADLLTVAHQG